MYSSSIAQQPALRKRSNKLDDDDDDDLNEHTPSKRTQRSSDTNLKISPFFNKNLQGSTPVVGRDSYSYEPLGTTSGKL